MDIKKVRDYIRLEDNTNKLRVLLRKAVDNEVNLDDISKKLLVHRIKELSQPKEPKTELEKTQEVIDKITFLFKKDFKEQNIKYNEKFEIYDKVFDMLTKRVTKMEKENAAFKIKAMTAIKTTGWIVGLLVALIAIMEFVSKFGKL